MGAATLPAVLNTLTREESTPQAEVLAAESQRGSLEAFEQLVGLFEKRIYNFLLHHTGNAHDAQDIAQETFVKVWVSIHRFDTTRDFAAWIFVIARRTAANHFRSRKVYDELPETLPAEGMKVNDTGTHLWKVARQLKPRYFEALWLRYAEDFSVKETAQIMGLTTIHLKVILHRARHELARHLKKEDL